MLIPQIIPPINWVRAAFAFRILPAPKQPSMRATLICPRSVYKHGAGAALPVIASFLCSGEAGVFARQIKQRDEFAAIYTKIQ
jgi:hypothetical protein